MKSLMIVVGSPDEHRLIRHLFGEAAMIIPLTGMVRGSCADQIILTDHARQRIQQDERLWQWYDEHLRCRLNPGGILQPLEAQ